MKEGPDESPDLCDAQHNLFCCWEQVVLQEEAEVEDALAPGNYASSEELDDMEADQGSDLSDE